MIKNNKLFVVWGIVLVVIIALLTCLGFILKGRSNSYSSLETKLENMAKKYVDNRFLYPEGKDTITITSEELIEAEYLDNLEYDNDKCTGYVVVSKDGVYKYKTFIKCNNYKTRGYSK